MTRVGLILKDGSLFIADGAREPIALHKALAQAIKAGYTPAEVAGSRLYTYPFSPVLDGDTRAIVSEYQIMGSHRELPADFAHRRLFSE